MASSRSAVYVYCLVAAARRPSRAGLPAGLPGASRPELTAVADGLFLVTSDVPLSVYGPDQLGRRLRSLEWVADVAVAHEALVEHFARPRRATVVPMKMFTMFSTIEKAADDIRRRRRTIDRAVRRVAGCEEWGMRIMRAATDAPASRSRVQHRQPAGGSGTSFLAARKDARDQARASRLRSESAAAAALIGLQRLARDVRRRDGTADPGTNPPLVEAAFLIASRARRRFKAAARRHAAACAAGGASLVLTGPWPAYNFVGQTEEDA
ncbi:MAG TPA: GvpL/GvpF family gas vesicle protein [Vicinamibacterales bacterium]